MSVASNAIIIQVVTIMNVSIDQVYLAQEWELLQNSRNGGVWWLHGTGFWRNLKEPMKCNIRQFPNHLLIIENQKQVRIVIELAIAKKQPSINDNI